MSSGSYDDIDKNLKKSLELYKDNTYAYELLALNEYDK
jgi:hypothetical protein